MASKRKQFSLEDKIKILKAVDSGRKKGDIAKEFGISPSTLSTFIKDRAQIEKRSGTEFDPSRKRLRTGKHADVDSATYKWLCEMRSQNIVVSGPMLSMQAKNFANMCGIYDFKATTGWLKLFRRRFGVKSKRLHGEEAAAPVGEAIAWREREMQNILKDYDLENIYNADETGMFYQLLPERTMTVKGDRCKGGKKLKQRITALFCCNATGTDKLKPLIIGRSQNPRCFKKAKCLAADYKANTKAWMTSQFFKDWLLQIDKSFVLKKKKICLIVDNASAHNDVPPGLKNVKVVFLPPNCTSILQPLDQGIIRSVKAKYRHRMLERILVKLRMKADKPTQMDLREAIEMTSAAWRNVTSLCITNCWRKAGLTDRIEDAVEEEDEDGIDDVENIDAEEEEEVDIMSPSEINDLQELFFEYGNNVDVPTGVTLFDYLYADDDVAVAAETTDLQILQEVQDRDNELPASDDSEDENTAPPPQDNISVNEAINMCEQLQRFLSTCSEVPLDYQNNLDDIRVFCVRNALQKTKQKQITDFFRKGDD